MDALIQYIEAHAGLFTAAGGVAAIVTAFCTYLKLRKNRSHLEQEIGELSHQRGQLQERNQHLEQRCEQATAEVLSKQNELNASREIAEQKQAELTQALEESREQTVKLEKKEKSVASLIKRMMDLEGRLWEKRIFAGTPKFRPLAERKTPIISVINLKGGVGKTTVTAHIGAAFANRGYRPLFIDLDLQGSLSSMFLPLDLFEKRSDEKLMLQHFLNHAAHHRQLNLLDYILPIMEDRGGLVATSDAMAYAELNLTMHWLLRLGKRDTRFLLRKALHQRRVTNQYDVVLLDCPPVINTGCVNALAASDYVLIPVTPSKKSAERVPQLLEMIRELGGRLNPSLSPLGLLFNRTFGASLTGRERDFWQQLKAHCQDRWNAPVHAFETNIRQTTEVRDSEAEFQMPVPGSELHDTFQRLVLEIEERLPRECRRTATAPVES